jgi:hypothetical protein
LARTAGEDCNGNSGNQATELKIADPPKQKTWVVGTSLAMSIRIVACESFSQRFVRREPSRGLVGRKLVQQYQHQTAATFVRAPVLLHRRHPAHVRDVNR